MKGYEYLRHEVARRLAGTAAFGILSAPDDDKDQGFWVSLSGRQQSAYLKIADELIEKIQEGRS